jgi:hypothetical protein
VNQAFVWITPPRNYLQLKAFSKCGRLAQLVRARH